MINEIFNKIYKVDYRLKILILLTIELVLFYLIVILAYFNWAPDFSVPEPRVALILAIAPLLSVFFLFVAHAYRSATRYQSVSTEGRFISFLSLAPMVWGAIILALGAGFPRSVILMYWLASVLAFVVWRRFLAGLVKIIAGDSPRRKDRRAIVILGAGTVGVQLATSLSNQGYYRTVAFLDDEPSLLNRRVHGLRVYHIDRAREVIVKYHINELLIAKPEMRRGDRRSFVRSLAGLSVTVKSVPSLSEFALGRWKVSEVRDIPVEELLGRDPVLPVPELVARSVRGNSVLVTGAGGSIGSELVRQVAQEAPVRVVLFDSSEFMLYESNRRLLEMLKQSNLLVEVHCVVGSVTDRNLVAQTLRKYGVTSIFHAAAYKHVGLMEHNSASAVMNNVFGTLTLVRCAAEFGVGRVVLVSTDKAVRPTSIMGATKRVAEMIVQAMAEVHDKTVFTMVRFGNVLGSSGSVVPIFSDQINKGGPVTVTHPDVTRYFMLISEAAQLVIQAGGLAKGGEVYLLEMGEPVKIAALARSMINLAGLEVREPGRDDGDIAIEFTGLQPGEKIFEELLVDGSVVSTEHPLIFKANENFLPLHELESFLDELRSAAESFDEIELRRVLQSLVDGVLRADDIENAGAVSADTGKSYSGDLGLTI